MAVIRVLEAISAGFGVVWQRGDTQDVSDDLARLLVTQRRAEYVAAPAAPADWLVPVMKKVDEVGQGSVAALPVAVTASRDLTAADNGAVLECAAAVTLTLPTGLPAGFACVVVPSGTTSIASRGGVLINGATTTVSRSASSNVMFAIQARIAENSFIVSGA